MIRIALRSSLVWLAPVPCQRRPSVIIAQPGGPCAAIELTLFDFEELVFILTSINQKIMYVTANSRNRTSSVLVVTK